MLQMLAKDGNVALKSDADDRIRMQSQNVM